MAWLYDELSTIELSIFQLSANYIKEKENIAFKNVN